MFLSIYIIYVVFRFFDGILGPVINIYFRSHFGVYVPGLGLILFVFILTFIGFLSTHLFSKQAHRFLAQLPQRFPLIRSIYPSIKQAFDVLFSNNQLAFKKAVLVEYPCKGSWSVGFITNESFPEAKEKIGEDLLNVFIPLAPNPLTGFVALIARKDIVILNTSVKEAMKLVITGGILNPGDAVENSTASPLSDT